MAEVWGMPRRVENRGAIMPGGITKYHHSLFGDEKKLLHRVATSSMHCRRSYKARSECRLHTPLWSDSQLSEPVRPSGPAKNGAYATVAITQCRIWCNSRYERGR